MHFLYYIGIILLDSGTLFIMLRTVLYVLTETENMSMNRNHPFYFPYVHDPFLSILQIFQWS